MNAGQLEILIAIAETGSLTEAAHSVSLTQSAVSHSLNRLESELGVTLVDRGRQGATLTHIGEVILLHARQVLDRMEVIRQIAARERGVIAGKLRFGAVPNIGAQLLTGIIRDFQIQHPQIDLVLFEGSPPELMTWLDEGIIDVGTVILPDAYAHTVPLAHNDIHLMMSAQHPLAGQSGNEPVALNTLQDEALIGPKAVYEMIRQLLQLQAVRLPPLRYDVSNYSTIFSMVRENLGIALVPGQLVDAPPAGLVIRPIEPLLTLDVYLAGRNQSPVVTRFMDYASTWAIKHGFLSENT